MLNIFMQQNSKDRNSHFHDNGNDKVAPIFAKKAYKVSRCTNPIILNLGARLRWVVNISLRPP